LHPFGGKACKEPGGQIVLTVSENGAHARRLHDRPVIEAESVPGYGAVFNAGLLHHDGRYHLFARGIRSGYTRNDGPGPRFLDYISDVLVFTSDDGFSYEFAYVLCHAGMEGVHCFEDPRVQRVLSGDDEHIVMTYTNLPPYESGRPWRIGAHRLRWEGNKFVLEESTGQLLGPHDIANKDAIVFTLADKRVALIHRIQPDMQLAVFDDLEHLWNAGPEYWDEYLAHLDAHTLIRPSRGALGIGAGAPPVETEAGFLLFFHERRADGAYTINLALLDKATGRLKSRLPHPLLVPELEWEIRGDVDNVVFVQGAHRIDDDVYLAYGAADRCIGIATAKVSHLLDALHAAS
jgi:beta-1,2-mannobiose phosphorylase / 1,2-beta-oligomannan phosphorylase